MAKSYSVEVVGESNYQGVIEGLREGEHVSLVPEPDNPHDPRAISVRDGDGAVFGYIARDHWLTRAIHDEGKVADATVKSINGGTPDAPSLGVVLTVTLGSASNTVPEPEPQGIMAKAAAAAVSAAEKEQRKQRMKAGLGPEPDEPEKDKGKGLGVGCAIVVGLLLLLALCGDGEDDTGASAADPAEKGAASQEQREAVREWHSSIMAAVSPCDLASAGMANQMTAIGNGGGSMLEGYRAARVAKDRCLDSFSMVGDIDGPSGPWEDEADEVTDTCRTAMSQRRAAADAAMTVFDGDFSASAMSELQDSVESGAQYLQLCAIGAIQVATDAGFELGENGELVSPESAE